MFEALTLRRRGVAVPIPVLPPDQLRLRDVFDCWRSRAGSRDAKTLRSFEHAFELFGAQCNAHTARLVRKPEAVAFRNALLSGGKHSPVTVSKLLSFLRAAFQAAVDDGLLDANPFAGVRVIESDREGIDKSRLPFNVDQLNCIFSGPVYDPDYIPRPSLGAACRWLPVLALFEGARLEELAQLEVDDIHRDPKHGYYLQITSAGDRRLKTASSRRNIPIHPTLLELGFIDYVKNCGTGKLFPALRSDKYGRLGTQFSTWFGRYLDSLGMTDKQLVFNSYRHTFVQLCKSKAHAGVPPEIREAIVGHLSPKQIEMTYGMPLYPLEPQVAAMRRVTYKGLDLTKVSAALGTSRKTPVATRKRQKVSGAL